MAKLAFSSTALLLASTLAVAGCDVGASGPGGPGGDPPVSGDELAISGDITEDATWAGQVRLVDDAVIREGVTVTIAPGTVFTANQTRTLRVHGVLSVEGTAEQPVSMTPAGELAWAGVVVEPGGQANIAHATGTTVATLLFCKPGAVFCGLDSVTFTGITKAMDTAAPSAIVKSRLEELSNGGVLLRAGGDLEITDSFLLFSTHDLLISSGGRLVMDHSEIGAAQGGYDHCAFHFSSIDELVVTRSNIVSSVYGMMIGSARSAVFNNNNFIGNTTDVADYGNNVSVDMRQNFWASGVPALDAPFDVSDPAAQQIADAGPRI